MSGLAAAPRHRRVRPGALVAATVVVVVLGLATFGEHLTSTSPTALAGVPWSPPGERHPLGTDGLGRDVLARLVHGGRLLVVRSVPAGLTAAALGTALGLWATVGGRVERVTLRGAAAALSVPGLLVVLVAAVALPAGAAVLVGTLVLGVPLTARVVHATARPVRRTAYVDAARLRGEGEGWIVVRELLPAVRETVVADAALRVVGALQLAVAIHVLHLGPAPPRADWAVMIRENLAGAGANPASVLAPAAALALLATALGAGVDGIGRAAGRRP